MTYMTGLIEPRHGPSSLQVRDRNNGDDDGLAEFRARIVRILFVAWPRLEAEGSI